MGTRIVDRGSWIVAIVSLNRQPNAVTAVGPCCAMRRLKARPLFMEGIEHKLVRESARLAPSLTHHTHNHAHTRTHLPTKHPHLQMAPSPSHLLLLSL